MRNTSLHPVPEARYAAFASAVGFAVLVFCLPRMTIAQQNDAVTQNMVTVYHWQLGLGIDFSDAQSRNLTAYTPGISISYSAAPLAHDAAQPGIAWKQVIPGARFDASLETGPLYPGSPDRYTFRGNAEGMLGERFSAGGDIRLATSSYTDAFDQVLMDYNDTRFTIGPRIMIWPTQQMRITESAGYGADIAARSYAGSDAPGSRTVQNWSILFFEHTFTLALSRTFGYMHAFEVESIAHQITHIEFENIIEAPLTPVFSIGMTVMPERDVPSTGVPRTRLSVGMLFAWYPDPLAMIMLRPQYRYDVEKVLPYDTQRFDGFFVDAMLAFRW